MTDVGRAIRAVRGAVLFAVTHSQDGTRDFEVSYSEMWSKVLARQLCYFVTDSHFHPDMFQNV